MDIIVGTAGHIDHGKTTLIKAITGTDTDRLPEEKQRGITIDLGFAELDLGDVRVGFVDVPGHERFVKNMLAGASGIDMVLLVIAANEGVMPQTREHFVICRLLGVKSGIIVLTKADLADGELLDLVTAEAAELAAGTFLEAAPIIAVSAETGAGIEQLKQTLKETISTISARSDDFVSRLPIDRSFTVKGFGAVVTGTLFSGRISETDQMELHPKGKIVRIRGLQTHKQTVKIAHAGQRTAANLGGIDHQQIERGMVLAERGILRPTQIIDVELEILKNAARMLKSRQRVRVHIGTAEILARVSVLNDAGEVGRGDRDFAQLRLESPVVTVPGERLIIRSYSPQVTIGGGSVLDPLAGKHKKKEVPNVRNFLRSLLESGDDHAERVLLFVQAAGESAMDISALQARTGLRLERLQEAIAKNLNQGTIIETGGLYLAREPFLALQAKILTEVRGHHMRDPLSKGILRETLRERIFGFLQPEIFRFALSKLEAVGELTTENESVRLNSHRSELSLDETALKSKLSAIFEEAQLEVPKLDETLIKSIENSKLGKEHARKLFQQLIDSGEVIKVTDEFYFSKTALSELTDRIRRFAAGAVDRLIDVPKFKEIAGVSRKYAIPLLEYFDREKITVRSGDKRLIL